MKKLTILMFLLMLGFQFQIFAQMADTVDVPYEDNEGYVNVLARFIIGDTTDTGERNNINRVYRLERGKVYLMDAKTYFEFPLTLIADEDETVAPPVIAPYPLDDGSIPRITFYLYEDSYIKNIYFLGIAPNGDRNSWDRPLIIGGEGTKLVLDDCICDGFNAAGIANIGENTSLFAYDCIWRNLFVSRQFGGQFFFNYGSYMDTISIVNCTDFCGSSYFLCPASQYTNYIRFEHNTLFINKINPFYTPYLSTADIKNNIFFCPDAAGETETERNDGWYDWDGERMAVFSIDTIPSDMAETYGMSEANRSIDFVNNAYFWPQEIQDYWANNDTVDAPVWINDRTQAMFDDDTNYPYLVMENNIEADPGFDESIMTMVDSVLEYITALREGGTLNGYYYNPGGGSLFPGIWPLPEDLAYSNTDLMTAGTDGLPLGDLNWFPDKKAEWENMQTGIKDSDAAMLPKEFVLYQNYPNPFNPTTLIKFTLNRSAHAKLTVYNMLGQKVRTLLDENKPAGLYSVAWDGRNDLNEELASGIYYYHLETASNMETRKMIFLK